MPNLNGTNLTAITSGGQIIYSYLSGESPNFICNVTCWDTNTNQQVWSAQPSPAAYFAEALVVDETHNAVYMSAAGGTLWSFRLDTGAVNWTKSVRVQPGANCLAVNGGQIYCLNALCVLYVFDSSGNELWTAECNYVTDPNIPAPFPVGLTIDAQTNTLACVMAGPYAGSYDPNDQDIASISALSLTSKSKLWAWNSGHGQVSTNKAPMISGGCGRIFVACNDGFVRALNASTGQIDSNWSFATLGTPTTPPVFSPSASDGSKGSVFVGSNGGNLYAIDGVTGKQQWTTPIAAASGASLGLSWLVLSPLDGLLYCYGTAWGPVSVCLVDPAQQGLTFAVAPVPASTSGNVRSFPQTPPLPCYGVVSALMEQDDFSTNPATTTFPLYSVDLSWATSLSSTSSSALSAAAGAQKTLQVRDRQKHPLPNTTVSVWAHSPVTIEHDGQTTTLAANQKLSLQTDGSGNLRLGAQFSGGRPELLIATPTTPAGASFVVPFPASLGAKQHAHLHAAPLGAPPVKRQIIVESELMPATYVQGSASGLDAIQPQNASYQTYIKLVDRNGNPRTQYAATFSATSACTITCNGVEHAVGPGQPVTVNTDNSGQLSIVSAGTSGFTVPTLLMECAFMTGGALGINPDHLAVNKVATMQASQLDPSTAKAYDGAPLLKTAYQTEDNRTAIASMFQNTIGGQGRTTTSSLHRPNAFVQTNANVSFLAQGVKSASPGRPWSPGPDGSFSFKITPTGCTFTPLTSQEAASAIARHLVTNNIFDDIADFVSNVVHGVEQVVDMTVHAVETAVTFVINGVKNAYHFVVTTIEDAATVVAGIVKTIADAVERFIEFLSFLLDWKAYIELAGQIRDHCSDNLNAFKSWWSASSPVAEINGFFDGIIGDVESLVGSATSALGGQSVGGGNASYNDPQAQFSTNGASSYGKTRWVTDKVQAHLSTATFRLSASQTDAFDQLIGAFQGVWTAGESALTSAVPTLADDVGQAFVHLSQRFTNPAGFTAGMLADFLNLLGDVVVTLVKAAKATAAAFLAAVGAVLDAIWAILQSPIDIPVISWIYKLVTGSDLSIIDVFSLIVAVPTRIITRLVGATELGAVNVMKVAYSLSLTVLTMFDFVSALTDEEDPATKIFGAGVLALTTISALLGMPFRNFPSLDPAGWQDYLIWGLAALPVIGGALDYAVATGHQSPFLQGKWVPYHNRVYCFYGFGMIAAFSVYAAKFGDYLGKNGDALIQNLFSVIVYPFKPLADDKETLPFVAAITVIGDGVNAGMSYQYLTD